MLSVIVPVLDEAETIPELVRRLREAIDPLGDFEVIFVNDGSTDATASLLRELHREDKRIKSLHLA